MDDGLRLAPARARCAPAPRARSPRAARCALALHCSPCASRRAAPRCRAARERACSGEGDRAGSVPTRACWWQQRALPLTRRSRASRARQSLALCPLLFQFSPMISFEIRSRRLRAGAGYTISLQAITISAGPDVMNWIELRGVTRVPLVGGLVRRHNRSRRRRPRLPPPRACACAPCAQLRGGLCAALLSASKLCATIYEHAWPRPLRTRSHNSHCSLARSFPSALCLDCPRCS
jgi:hypothetical protein